MSYTIWARIYRWQMSVPVIDLHCDLLAYLRVDPEKNSPLDPISNCSIPLLEKGKVRLQTLALWSETAKGSYQRYLEELHAYHKMLRDFKERVTSITDYDPAKKQVHFALAIENLSCLLEEGEPFEHLIERLKALDDPLLYVSLTWNEENRFGGGNLTQVGLKREGEIALEILAEEGIAVDLSHTSDPLADDILNYIHKKGLKLQPIASHSNFRSILNCPRNLPDVVAKEIANLGGVIGINFIRVFIGEQNEDFLKHIQYGIELLGPDVLALGGDLFGGIETPTLQDFAPYYLQFDSSACYPEFFHFLEKELSHNQIQKIAHINAEQFLIKQGLIHKEEVNNGTCTP